MLLIFVCLYFFFNGTATTEIYTLSLHDALPICPVGRRAVDRCCHRLSGIKQHTHPPCGAHSPGFATRRGDRKSTRLNSSHVEISYAVFCLKKKHYSRRQR